jgi:hypothetical protein
MPNCVNCGAPPRGKYCAYCQSPASALEERANRSEFKNALRVIDECDFDDARVANARALAKLGLRFTAGQSRRLAETCDYDDARGDILRALITCTMNPGGLLAAVDIFDYDDARTELLDDLVRAGVKFEPRLMASDEDTVYPGEDDEYGDYEEPVPDGYAPARVWGIALLLFACIFGLVATGHITLSP